MTVPPALAGIEKLANFVADPDVALLDRVLSVFYSGAPQEPLLTRLQEDPNAWQRVDTILEYSRNQYTKFYALQILESLIKFRWKILPRDQCQAIKIYIVGLVIKYSQTDEMMQREKIVLGKLNDVLIQVVKQEWPRQWESFIPELVASSASAESICENNIQILKRLSEEIFDFSSGQMTQSKIMELKNSFNKEFQLIYKLLEHILDNSQKPSLVLVSLQTLLRFLNWIPLGYIFETKIVETLLFKFFTVPMFRNVTLKCLTEIGSLSVGSLHDAHFGRLFVMLMTQLRNVLPVTADIAGAYDNGTQDQQDFIADLSLFFSGFFKAHLTIMESPEAQQLNLEAHAYLAKLTLVSEVEVFKICLEYWNILAADLYNESPFASASNSGRRGLYSPILTQVRLALIGRMAKPEEVLVVEEEGEIIREVSKDVDAIILYKSMKETLVYLTNLNCDDTQRIMLDKLQRQVNGTEWSWHNLNTLCWAVGSISGAMSEDDEKKFLVHVIKDLLGLCEMKKGKDNKAVVASNIMYIVGQYPRFLRAHWKFLRTVVNKLVEFMHELHPGVQDMAVETYCKIAQKCRRKFVVTQPSEPYPFVDEILETLPNIISDLQPAQIHTFYEATGYMISAQADPRARDALILKLMHLPNQSWTEMMAQANHTIDYLRNAETAKSITNILKTNTHAAQSLGHCYVVQLGRIFMDLLNVYRVYSETISTQVATGGQYAAQSSGVRSMRAVKRETLRLLEAFISKSEDPKFVYQNFVPPLLNAVLGDYKMIIPETRDAEVLSLLSAIISKLKTAVLPDVPRILDHVFEATLTMITRNFEDFPEIRLQFFILLRSINQCCFQAFFMIPQQHFKLVIDSVVWAFKHPTRNIAEIGVNILLELWKNIAQSEVAQPFYQAYFLSLLQDILFVLTDTFHKSAFKLHALILLHMFHAVQSGQVSAPLWEAAKVQVFAGTDNRTFLREYVVNLLASGFKNLTPQQLQGFVNGLFSLSGDLAAFKNHIRDFLVLMREFSSGDNSELFLDEEEATKQAAAEQHKKKMLAIPGMIAPQDHPGFDDMS